MLPADDDDGGALLTRPTISRDKPPPWRLFRLCPPPMDRPPNTPIPSDECMSLRTTFPSLKHTQVPAGAGQLLIRCRQPSDGASIAGFMPAVSHLRTTTPRTDESQLCQSQVPQGHRTLLGHLGPGLHPDHDGDHRAALNSAGRHQVRLLPGRLVEQGAFQQRAPASAGACSFRWCERLKPSPPFWAQRRVSQRSRLLCTC